MKLFDNYSKIIDELLEELEKAKESGMVVSIDVAINILKNEG